MAELNVGIFLGCLCHEGLVAEGVCKDYIAAVVGKVKSCFVAVVVFGNVGFHHNLIVGKTKIFAGKLCCIDEVFVIGRVFVVKEDEADFKVFDIAVLFAAVRAACKKSEHHDCCEYKRKNLFHFVFASVFTLFLVCLFFVL